MVLAVATVGGDGTMNTILKAGGIKDAIGVLFLVITGLLYATGVTENAIDVVSDVGLNESSVGAAIEVPQGSGCRGADYPLASCGKTSPCNPE